MDKKDRSIITAHYAFKYLTCAASSSDTVTKLVSDVTCPKCQARLENDARARLGEHPDPRLARGWTRNGEPYRGDE